MTAESTTATRNPPPPITGWSDAAQRFRGELREGDSETRYTAGTYVIRDDSVYLTSTFSSQPSQLLGRSQAYRFRIEGSKLTISGSLPNGMKVEEYWKKIR